MTIITDLRDLLNQSMTDEGAYVTACELLDRLAFEPSPDTIRDAALEEAAKIARTLYSDPIWTHCQSCEHCCRRACELYGANVAYQIRSRKSQPTKET